MTHGYWLLMHRTFFVAATIYFLGALGVLVWLLVRARNAHGASTRSLAGQEIVWTLIPALLLIVLTVIAESSQPSGTPRTSPSAGAASTWLK